MRADDFNLGATLESGQVFGFRKRAPSSYEGMLLEASVRLRQEGPTLFVERRSGRLLPAQIQDYFDLEKDLSTVYSYLSQDKRLRPLLRLKGLRLIRQNSWEALACFIISSNNNVKRIQGIWKNLAQYFSPELNGQMAGFPSAMQIARSHERILKSLGLGYRAEYLLSTARFVASNPESLGAIREAEYREAFRRIVAFPGIGPKVADCALLYGFHKLEAFPVDVWILRVMRKLYFKNRRVSEDRVRLFGQRRWGEQAGYIQQYLFHGARTGLI